MCEKEEEKKSVKTSHMHILSILPYEVPTVIISF